MTLIGTRSLYLTKSQQVQIEPILDKNHCCTGVKIRMWKSSYVLKPREMKDFKFRTKLLNSTYSFLRNGQNMEALMLEVQATDHLLN